MRILFLAMDAFGGLGGIAQYNRDFLQALGADPRVAEVVALPRRLAWPPEALPPKLTYITAGAGSRLGYIRTVIKVLGARPRFDIICCGHLKLLPLGGLARLRTGAPMLLMIYGVDAWEPQTGPLARYLLSRVDFLLSISEITRERFMAWSHMSPKKTFILPNAVRPEDYGVQEKSRQLAERYGLEGKTVLMTLGRLAAEEKYKGFDEIMDLLPSLAQEIPDIAYLIVGDGDDKPRLEAKARALGVADRVRFAGFVPEAEKADHYRLADAFVMPGRGEGFGFVFLEALACGVPAVGSKLDGSREALRGGALGRLVDPGNPAEIKAAILEVLKRPRGVIPPGLEYFSYENFARRTHEILGQVMGAPR
jgi:phosphatidylinositol alpha-1,6-mannosyltransferase